MMHKQNILNIFNIIQTWRGELIGHIGIINSNTFMLAGDANIGAASLASQGRAASCINIVITSPGPWSLQISWQR